MKREIIATALILVGMALFVYGGGAFVQNNWDTAYLPAAGIGLLLMPIAHFIE